MTPAQFIKKIRLSLCVTQTEFGVLINRDKTSVCLYEAGKRRPSYSAVRKMVQIARENGIEANYIDIRNE